MSTKVYKPFWNYDVEKTEQWLISMASKGFLFVKLNTITRQFLFKKGKPKQIVYQIVFDKENPSVLPSTLLDDGWKRMEASHHWHIYTNEKPIEEINTFPTREGVIRHNRLVLYVYIGILIYL